MTENGGTWKEKNDGSGGQVMQHRDKKLDTLMARGSPSNTTTQVRTTSHAQKSASTSTPKIWKTNPRTHNRALCLINDRLNKRSEGGRETGG
jgi:hypothetical protein